MPCFMFLFVLARRELRGALWGALWGALGRSGEIWGALGSSAELWGALGSSGQLWGALGSSGWACRIQAVSFLISCQFLGWKVTGCGFRSPDAALKGALKTGPRWAGSFTKPLQARRAARLPSVSRARQALAAALRRNTAVKELHLSQNDIGDVGAEAPPLGGGAVVDGVWFSGGLLGGSLQLGLVPWGFRGLARSNLPPITSAELCTLQIPAPRPAPAAPPLLSFLARRSPLHWRPTVPWRYST